MKKIILYLFVLIGLPAQGQLQQLYNQSVEAYQAKDYAMFLKLNQKMDSIRPWHPTVMYNLAAAYALNQNTDASIAALKRLLLMDNTVIFEEDADFESVSKTEAYQQAIALKKAQNQKVATSVYKLSLSEKDLHPEGLLYLEKQKLWLATSIRLKKIVSFDGKGQCKDWFTDSRYSVFSMKTDPSQKYLWATTSAMPAMKGYTPAQDGQNQILKIDLATRKIVASFSMQGKHTFGDLAVAANGDVYISDSNLPYIYRIKDNSLALWKDLTNQAFNLQGITFSAGQRALFIADYVKGIGRIPLEDRAAVSWFTFPQGTTTKGIDGLLYYKGSLLAIHNGTVPIRIVRYQLNASEDRITEFKLLDNNREDFNEPALGTISKGKMYFFANAPWKFYNPQNELDLAKFDAPRLYVLDLN